MRNLLAVTLLLLLVTSACSPSNGVTGIPIAEPSPSPSLLQSPGCRDNICIQEATVSVDTTGLIVSFSLTDRSGKVDVDHPPKFTQNWLSADASRIEADGTEESVFGVYQASDGYICDISNRFVWAKGQLLAECTLLVPHAATTARVQVGDRLKVTLKEFGFEQIVTAREFAKRKPSNGNGPTSITDAFLIKSTLPGDPFVSTTTFSQNQPVIHLVVVTANATSDAKIKVVWTAVDVGKAAPANTKLGEAEYAPDSTGTLDLTISRSRSGVWPIGKYKVDIYLNDKLDRTLEFRIE